MEYKYNVHSSIDDHKDEVIRVYETTPITLKEIGKLYGCCGETVRRRLTEWGVQLRTRAQWTGVKGLKNLEVGRLKRIEFVKANPPKGELNPRWQGGKSVHYFKQLVLARDGRKCRLCGYDEHPEIIEVDHINGNHFDNRLENGWALCPNCHRIEEFKRRTFHTKLRPKRYV